MPDFKHFKKMSALGWKPAADAPFAIADVWAREDPRSDADPDLRHIDIEAHKLKAGVAGTPQFHEGHSELVMVWRGKGTLRYAGDDAGVWRAARTVELSQYQTATIPPRTLRQFVAATDSPEDLILITVHALNGTPLVTDTAQFGTQQDSKPALEARNVEAIAGKIDNGKRVNWEENSDFRAKRVRIWGKEAPAGEGGGVDRIKPELHFTLYTFVRKQKNPGHFHPNSVEFVMALDSGAQFKIRPKLDGDGWTDPANAQSRTLEAGDLVLVPLAGWHEYVNSPANEVKIMALQTPHPIMHTLLDETDGEFDPVAVGQ